MNFLKDYFITFIMVSFIIGGLYMFITSTQILWILGWLTITGIFLIILVDYYINRY